ncbi:MAG: PHP domain-containing protein [Propionibacteriaceae bacterium]|nr:PHP domain-containing protein [Propionibacteriaceae bacterium]
MRIDLHTHSCVSDGTDTPAELVAEAARAGLDVVALTDHDTFAGLPEARRAGQRLGVRVVDGIEISTRLNGVGVHLLGYWCDAADVDLAAELARVREGRAGRVPDMLAKLAELGMPVDEATLAGIVAGKPSVGRPHVADAMIALGYVADRAEAFDKYLHEGGPAYADRYCTPLAPAIGLIHQAGGAAVIAHPWGRESRPELTEEAFAALAADHGLDGIEVDHEDHCAADRRALAAIAARLGLVATGSSDYHGAGKAGHRLGCHTTSPSALAALEARARRANA